MQSCFIVSTFIFALARSRVLKSSGVVVVTTPDRTCDVTNYGAIGDGHHDDTKSVQKAIDDCASHGGGNVVFPNNRTFLLFPIVATGDNLSFDIQPSSTLLMNNDRKSWPNGKNFISASNKIQNFAIVGGGTINGQGLVWWQNRNDFRPHTVDMKANNVLLYNFTVRDPPNHCLEMETSNTEISHVTILAPPSTHVKVESHNTDAVDVHGSPFYVHDCYFNTGDDNIAAHANDTLVENCVFGTGHGASIGSLGGGWLRNITFRNIKFRGTTTGARIKVHNDAGPGRLWDVVYENLDMENVGTTIDVMMYYGTNKESKNQFKIDGVVFRNIKAKNSSKPGEFRCQSSSPCHGIVLDTVTHTETKGDWVCKDAHGSASNVTPKSCLEK